MRTYPNVCKRLLKILFKIGIDRIEINQEETISIDHNSKGIRLALFLKNDTQIFDVEQKAYDRRESMLEKALETAKNFLLMNVLTVEQIAQGTELTLDEVLEIKKTVAVAK